MKQSDVYLHLYDIKYDYFFAIHISSFMKTTNERKTFGLKPRISKYFRGRRLLYTSFYLLII